MATDPLGINPEKNEKTEGAVKRFQPPPLPATVDKLMEHRHLKQKRSINDMVEDIHLILYPKQNYRDFLESVWDSDAVEGSCKIDHTMAAQMIRAQAAEMEGYGEIKKKNLQTICLSLGVILRRYHLSRHERRNTVGGEVLKDGEE